MTEPLCILLVEDHADTRETLQRYLQSKGYEVLSAGSLVEAISIAATMRFDVLVSDIGLPDGNGVELISEMKRRVNVPAIAISGYFQPENEASYLRGRFRAGDREAVLSAGSCGGYRISHKSERDKRPGRMTYTQFCCTTWL